MEHALKRKDLHIRQETKTMVQPVALLESTSNKIGIIDNRRLLINILSAGEQHEYSNECQRLISIVLYIYILKTWLYE